MAKVENGSRPPKDVLKDEIVRLSGSRFAGYTEGEFLLRTEDGNKVVNTAVWRQGILRRVTHATVAFRDEAPRSGVEGSKAYGFTEIYPLSDHMDAGRYTEGSRPFEHGGEQTPEGVADGLSRMVGRTVTTDDIHTTAAELLGRVAREEAKLRGPRSGHVFSRGNFTSFEM